MLRRQNLPEWKWYTMFLRRIIQNIVFLYWYICCTVGFGVWVCFVSAAPVDWSNLWLQAERWVWYLILQSYGHCIWKVNIKFMLYYQSACRRLQDIWQLTTCKALSACIKMCPVLSTVLCDVGHSYMFSFYLVLTFCFLPFFLSAVPHTVLFSLISKNESTLFKSPVCLSVFL
jgi:hypothetical protein